MREFEHFEVSSVSEATSLLSKYGKDAKIIAGGTDLLFDIKHGYKRPRYLIDIKPIPELRGIDYEKGKELRIGALTTIKSVKKSPVVREHFPIISQSADQFGIMAVRTMATIGGNLCNAIPSADMVPGLMALSARVKLVGTKGDRIMPLENFIVSSGVTILEADEILTEILVPEPDPWTKGTYLKYAIRGKCDLPIVTVAVALTVNGNGKQCKDVRIVLGNVASTAIRALAAEKVLKEKEVSEDLIEECAEVARNEVTPREGSFRASADYKKSMVKVFVGRALQNIITK